MTRAENKSLPELWVLPRSCSKNTPGLRCSCETMTRSVPLITKEPLPEWLEIGNIEVNAACRPSFLRDSAAVNSCRKARYDESWVSSRNGTGNTLARLAKLLRMRFFSVKEY